MPDVPLPPSSLWDRYPEVAIIILVALCLVTAFVLYNERRDKKQDEARASRDKDWQKFFDEQRTTFIDALSLQRTAFKEMLDVQSQGTNVIVSQIVSELKGIRDDADKHDERMIKAIASMEAITRSRK